jgi:hypothetical protein
MLRRWAKYEARVREGSDLYSVLVKKLEKKGPKRRWENNIKMDLQERGWEVVD